MLLGSSSLASSQTFTNTVVQLGSNVISAAPASGVSNPTVALGALTGTPGALLQFIGPATSTAATAAGGTTGSSTPTASNSPTAIITTTTAGTGGAAQPLGIIQSGGTSYATVGLYDWATTDPIDASAGTSPLYDYRRKPSTGLLHHSERKQCQHYQFPAKSGHNRQLDHQWCGILKTNGQQRAI